MKNRIVVVLVMMLVATYGYARESFNEHLFWQPPPPPPPPSESPWFTGPLLTPSAHVVPVGHANYEPYIYWTEIKGSYDANWHPHSRPTFTNVLLQGTMQFGVYKNIEFDIAPQFEYNRHQGEHMWRVSDLPLTLAFQLLEDKDNKPGQGFPAIKLRFAGNVPLGKYDDLNPGSLGTDAGGVGTVYPSVGLVFSKLFQVYCSHYLSTRLFLAYSFGTPVHVDGLSVYGGAASTPEVSGTHGRVYPGNVFTILNGYEYSLTQNWVLALDIQYQHTNSSRFSGFSPPGTRPVLPSQELIGLAPAVEYNWSENIGFIAGPWFTVAGRNTGKFISYVAALNIYV